MADVHEFGPFRLDVRRRHLSRDGRAVAIAPKALDTLLVPIRRRDHVVGKDEIMREVWPATAVTDDSLRQIVWVIRRALSDHSEDPAYVATVPVAATDSSLE